MHAIIAGGGVSGLAVAAVLERQGHNITVVDPRAPGSDPG
jgi:2-polyprenyl-6-methoxyphenol hydroxylase-like FAD-dependent oxidoreductase